MENNTDPTMTCVCGKKCKGRRGLRKHQSTCKTEKLLHDGCRELINPVDPPSSDRPLDLSQDTPQNGPIDSPTDLDHDPARETSRSALVDENPDTLPGIKLPKNSKEWEEAAKHSSVCSSLIFYHHQ